MLSVDLDSSLKCISHSLKVDKEESTHVEAPKKKRHGKKVDVNLSDLDATSPIARKMMMGTEK